MRKKNVRDAEYQAKLMVEGFGAEKARSMVNDIITKHGANSEAYDYWTRVRKSIPDPAAYNRLLEWAVSVGGLRFECDHHKRSITICADQPMFVR